MIRRATKPVVTAMVGIGRALRARPGIFSAVAAGVFALNLVLPVAVLSLFRRPVDHFTFNPWLSRLPEWLASDVPLRRKLEFLSELALAWFSADNPVEGVEWGFIVDVPSLARFGLTAVLFGTYFALWAYRRQQSRVCGWGPRAARSGGDRRGGHQRARIYDGTLQRDGLRRARTARGRPGAHRGLECNLDVLLAGVSGRDRPRPRRDNRRHCVSRLAGRLRQLGRPDTGQAR